MAMNPRTHPRGAPPDFSMAGLPANPNPARITQALWWLVCMRDLLEPLSENGGVYANKPGYHNAGENLPDHGLGNLQTDHSIRRTPDRTGSWWEEFASAHDWTFTRAHTGNYTEINKYTNRLINSMRSLTDLRPDDVYAYTLGQVDNDRVVEGWNEYEDEPDTGDESHLWHRHDSFRRNIVGSFWHMWKALTIDMGWTYAEWQQSTEDDMTLDNADKTFISGSTTVGLCQSQTWPTGGGAHTPVGDAVLNTGWPLTPGASRTPDWQNKQSTYGKAAEAATNAAAGAASAAALQSLLAFLGMDISDPSWDPNTDPIVARVRYAIANPTP